MKLIMFTLSGSDYTSNRERSGRVHHDRNSSCGRDCAVKFTGAAVLLLSCCAICDGFFHSGSQLVFSVTFCSCSLGRNRSPQSKLQHSLPHAHAHLPPRRTLICGATPPHTAPLDHSCLHSDSNRKVQIQKQIYHEGNTASLRAPHLHGSLPQPGTSLCIHDFAQFW